MPLINRRGKILLATRNEKVTVPLVLEEIAEAIHGLEQLGWALDVVIVDDSDEAGLEEATIDLAKRLQIHITVHNGRHRGLGSAVIQGFEICLEDPTTEFIVNLDADGQHDARQMGDLLRMFSATDAGITIGSRWTKGGRCYGLTTARKVLSRSSSFALRQAGVPKNVKDPTTSFRVYRRNTVEILVRELLGFNGFSFFGAAIAIANAHGYEVNETPIHFRPRVGGNSNLSIQQTFRAAKDLSKIRSHWSMIKRREKAFTMIKSDPQNYTASRELEQLSNTPISTRIILDTLAPYIGKDILEVGAGLGLNTASLLNRGHKVVALEPDPGLFSKLKDNSDASRAQLINSTLETWISNEPTAPSFDTALYINVLEHIEDDVQELRIASKVCRPDGNIVIFVPATPSLYGSMDWISAHFRRYRAAELEAVARNANLRIIDTFYFDFVGKFPYWLMYRVFKKQSLGSSAVGLYDKVIVPMSARLPRWLMKRTGGKNLVLICTPDNS